MSMGFTLPRNPKGLIDLPRIVPIIERYRRNSCSRKRFGTDTLRRYNNSHLSAIVMAMLYPIVSSGHPCRRSYHTVLLLSPPGAGKSMLAGLHTTILPTMNRTEAIETTCIHHVVGLTGDRTALVTTRPWRLPHYTMRAWPYG
jgi:hypothetical protein